MTLIKSISGMRGTIGGRAGDNLTPIDVVAFTAAFGQWLLGQGQAPKVVIGRDARISGEMLAQLVSSTLRSMGIHVVDLGLSTTPTVEMAVLGEAAGAGIVITASHNPKQWNALKFLNHRGEFISAADGEALLHIVASGEANFAAVEQLGGYEQKTDYIQRHIEQILALPLVDVEAVRGRNFRVVVDAVNSTGGLALSPLLEALGCETVLLNGEPNGLFAHNPEPLPEHLSELSSAVLFHRAHLGIAVDPDVDRVAFVCEDGEMFGEEYTLVAVADYVLRHAGGGDTVSNLSSTQALRDVTRKHGGAYFAAPVGEVNVVEKMKAVGAIIGGEGNGGVIYPALHYGRDALVGVALFLSHLAQFGKPASFLRGTYPAYTISKNKIQLTPDIDLDRIFAGLSAKYSKQAQNHEDGLKIEFDEDWIHLRRSNTEPIIRIYTESSSEVIANNLADKIKQDINEMLKG